MPEDCFAASVGVFVSNCPALETLGVSEFFACINTCVAKHRTSPRAFQQTNVCHDEWLKFYMNGWTSVEVKVGVDNHTIKHLPNHKSS